MREILKIVLLLGLVNQTIYAQESLRVYSGFIIDSETGLSIENVHIQNKNSQKGTVTNKLGFYKIESSQTDSLTISYISYNTRIICTSNITTYTRLKSSSLKLDEVILKPQTWQQFKLEFVQKEWKTEQSAEVTIIGLKQYKGPLRPFKPTLITAVTSPISFTHHLLNKKSRQKRKTSRYRKILQKSYYLDD